MPSRRSTALASICSSIGLCRKLTAARSRAIDSAAGLLAADDDDGKLLCPVENAQAFKDLNSCTARHVDVEKNQVRTRGEAIRNVCRASTAKTTSHFFGIKTEANIMR